MIHALVILISEKHDRCMQMGDSARKCVRTRERYRARFLSANKGAGHSHSLFSSLPSKGQISLIQARGQNILRLKQARTGSTVLLINTQTPTTARNSLNYILSF